MKPSVLLSLLRNLSYGGSFLVGAFALLALFQGWISLPYAAHPNSHSGVGLWTFDVRFLPVDDGVVYRGVRNENIFFSSAAAELIVGQEGTPPELMRLSYLKYGVTSVLLLLPATILWLFGRLFGAIKNGESFSAQSVRRIRAMGWCFIGYFVLTSLLGRVLYHFLAKDFPSAQIGSGYKSALTGETINLLMVPQTPNWNLSMAMFGLFAFALAEVLRQGLLLKQENDLTV